MCYNGVMTGSGQQPEHNDRSARAAPSHALSALRRVVRNRYTQSIAIVAVASLIGWPLHGVLQRANLVMLFLAAVLVCGLYLGRGPSVLAALLSVLSYDFFFVAPRFTLSMANSQDVLTFLGLLVVGLVTSDLTARVREEVQSGQRKEAETAALYALSRDLAVAASLDAIVDTVTRHVRQAFGCEGTVLLAVAGRLEGGVLPASALAAAQTAYDDAASGSRAPDITTPETHVFVPLQTAHGPLGILAMAAPPSLALSASERRLLAAAASVAALAIERAQLGEAARQAELLKATEQLQSALLNSVSHDLRTPLASISGVLTTLEEDSILNREERRSLAQTAREEAERLNRLVGDLLDMSRLEAGALRVHAEPCDAEDLVGSALGRLGRRLEGRQVRLDLPADTPPVMADFVLIVHALVNVIDNAVKYSPPDGAIDIAARAAEDMVQITVADDGAGIPDANLTRIFDKFQRVAHSDGVPGLGLGLSIARGIVEAHGGRIWAANRAQGGLVITLSVPRDRSDVTPSTPSTPTTRTAQVRGNT